MYDRDALLAAVELRALADELLGPRSGAGRSGMWRCPNDQHAQTGRTPPVSIFTSRRGEQRWRCHGCGEGGTAIDMVLACHGGTTREAMAYLAARAGHRETERAWRPPRRVHRLQPLPPAGCRDPEGLDRYVSECAERLATPEGRRLLRWLTDTRGLPRDLLLENRIGADPGPRLQHRPHGMPRAGGAVLPVIQDGRVVYAQIRVPNPSADGPRYLNPTAALATNPRLTRVRPVETRHAEVLVTEGAIDALSAGAAGYRAVGVLSATYADEAVAVALAKLPYRLVLAFDADDAGRLGADRLNSLLTTRGRPPVVLDLGSGDLNEAMRRSSDWTARLGDAVDHAVAERNRPVGVGLSR